MRSDKRNDDNQLKSMHILGERLMHQSLYFVRWLGCRDRPSDSRNIELPKDSRWKV